MATRDQIITEIRELETDIRRVDAQIRNAVEIYNASPPQSSGVNERRKNEIANLKEQKAVYEGRLREYQRLL